MSKLIDALLNLVIIFGFLTGFLACTGMLSESTPVCLPVAADTEGTGSVSLKKTGDNHLSNAILQAARRRGLNNQEYAALSRAVSILDDTQFIDNRQVVLLLRSCRSRLMLRMVTHSGKCSHIDRIPFLPPSVMADPLDCCIQASKGVVSDVLLTAPQQVRHPCQDIWVVSLPTGITFLLSDIQ